MSYPLVKVPKPKKRVKRSRTPLRKTRMRTRNAKRKGSAFPKVRDADFTRWLTTTNPCLLAQRMTRKAITRLDWIPWGGWYVHVCWGPIDPAHVGKHRSKGAPDVGATVPLCRAAHSFYDEHRNQWPHVTQFNEKLMARAASGYALKYIELGETSDTGAHQ